MNILERIIICFFFFNAVSMAADVHPILSKIEDIFVESECPECGLTLTTIGKEKSRITKSIEALEHSMKERLRKVRNSKTDLSDDQLALHAVDQINLLRMEITKLKIQQYEKDLQAKIAPAKDCNGTVNLDSRSAIKPFVDTESTSEKSPSTSGIEK